MLRHISTKNLIYLTLFFSPVYLIRFFFFEIPLNLLDVLILATLSIWLYENKLNLLKESAETSKKLFFISLPILFLFLGLFISSFLNDNFLKELGIIKSWFILPFVFGLIAFNTTKTIIDVQKILATYFFSTIFISIVSIFYFISGHLTYDGRLSAFYLSPNHLAMIISPGLLIGFWHIITTPKVNLFKIILITPILVALFLTHSYGAWLALLLSLFIILFFTHKKVTLIFVVLFFLFFIFESDSDKFKHLFDFQENSSLDSRVAIWKSATKILSDNWLWGIGPGNFQEKYLDYQKYFIPYPEWAVPQPHNLFLAFWLQTGLLGLIGFLVLLLLWFKKIIKILISTKDFHTKNILLILSTLLFSLLIHGLIDTPYWKNDLALVFWTIIFLGLAVVSAINFTSNKH